MAEVNPLIIIAAGSAVVGFASLVLCCKQSGDEAPKVSKKKTAPVEHITHAKNEAVADVGVVVKKGKKKVRKNKNKKSDNTNREITTPTVDIASDVQEDSASADGSASDNDLDEEHDVPVFSNKPTITSKVKQVKENGTQQKNSKAVDNKPKEQPKEQPKEAKKAAPVAEKPVKAAHKEVKEPKEPKESGLKDFSSSPLNAASSVPYDGWAVVEKKNPKKQATESEEPTTAAPAAVAAPVVVHVPETVVDNTPPAPVIETIVTPLTVDSRKLGLLIGPKGVTKIGIQTATGAVIEMPKTEKDAPPQNVTVTVSGTAEQVKGAVHALNELVAKGYSTLLAGDDFQEGYVAIHPRFLSEVIGKGGSTIKALQLHTGVKITTPSVDKKQDGSAPSKVKVGLAGPRDKVTEARNLIKDLTKYYHTSVTHPGVVHSELAIDDKYFNYIIGAKGSEIKHIQANFKVSVYIPQQDAAANKDLPPAGKEKEASNVLIVGEPANVAAAEKHIHKLVEKVDGILEQRAATDLAQQAYKAERTEEREKARAAAAEQRALQPRSPKPRDDEPPEEEWVKEYLPKTTGVDFAKMLPATAKFATPAAPTTTTPTSSTTEPAATEGV